MKIIYKQVFVSTIKVVSPIIGLICLGLLSVRELFRPGFFENHDGIIHVMRLTHFDEAIRSGQFPVRWVPTWMAGYGSPVFNFNWTLPYYLGSFLHLFGLSFQTSVEILFVSSMVLSGITLYIFLKELLEDRMSAVTGAILYMWAPYRFTDIFIRGALGEALSFVLLPLILFATLRALRTSRYPVWTSVVWAALILTHNIMAVIGGGLWLFSALFLPSLKNKIKFFLYTGSMFLIGVLLTSFFWLPALSEKKFDRISDLDSFFNNSTQYVPWSSLWSSTWRYAYALPQHPEHSMSFEVGRVHLAALLVVCIAFVISARRKKKQELRSYLRLFMVVTIGSVLLTNRLFRFVYDNPQVSSMINFPWRFLELVTLGLSLAIGVSLVYMGRVRYMLSAILIGSVIYFYWPYSKIISYVYTNTNEGYRSMVKTNINYLPDTEYLPKGAQYYQLLEERGPADSYPVFEPISGTMNFSSVNQKNLTYYANASVITEGEVRLQQLNFPGWEVRVDHKLTVIKPDNYGLLTFSLPEGMHTIEIVFRNTPIRTIANLVSLMSVLGFSLYALSWIVQKSPAQHKTR